jgi:hypothetical protein
VARIRCALLRARRDASLRLARSCCMLHIPSFRLRRRLTWKNLMATMAKLTGKPSSPHVHELMLKNHSELVANQCQSRSMR